MKNTKKLLASVVAASAVSVAAVAPVANAEVSASVGIANMYLWRGQDLGNGAPQVSGDLTYSSGGFYTGLAAYSGDAGDTEYDYFVGFGGESGDFSYDFSLWSYMYPSYGADSDSTIGLGELVEAALSLGYGDFSFLLLKGISDNSVATNDDYSYINLSYAFGDFTIAYGMNMQDYEDGEYSHIDLSYAYNDNLSFTLSTIASDPEDESLESDPLFVVSYSLPIE